MTASLAAFGFAEVFVRVSGLGNPRMMTFDHGIVKHKPFGHYVNKRETVNRVIYNNLGFHDRDRELQNGHERFLFMGDSFVEGVHVPADAVFTSLLEDLLGKERPVEVLNGGVQGSGTFYQYMLWKHYFRNRIRVDHVVLAFYMGNDLENNNPELTRLLGVPPPGPAFYMDGQGEIRMAGMDRYGIKNFAKKLANYSAVLNFFCERTYLLRGLIVRAWERSRAGRDPAGYEARLEKEWHKSIDQTLGLMARWHHELRRDNLGFSVLVIPDGAHAQGKGYGNEYKDLFMKRLRQYCREENIPFLPLEFEGQDPFSVYSFDGKTLGHFNRLGHRLAAEKIYQWISGD